MGCCLTKEEAVPAPATPTLAEKLLAGLNSNPPGRMKRRGTDYRFNTPWSATDDSESSDGSPASWRTPGMIPSAALPGAKGSRPRRQQSARTARVHAAFISHTILGGRDSRGTWFGSAGSKLQASTDAEGFISPVSSFGNLTSLVMAAEEAEALQTLTALPVGQLVYDPPIWAHTRLPFVEAMRALQKHGVRGLPVVKHELDKDLLADDDSDDEDDEAPVVIITAPSTPNEVVSDTSLVSPVSAAGWLGSAATFLPAGPAIDPDITPAPAAPAGASSSPTAGTAPAMSGPASGLAGGTAGTGGTFVVHDPAAAGSEVVSATTARTVTATTTTTATISTNCDADDEDDADEEKSTTCKQLFTPSTSTTTILAASSASPTKHITAKHITASPNKPAGSSASSASSSPSKGLRRKGSFLLGQKTTQEFTTKDCIGFLDCRDAVQVVTGVYRIVKSKVSAVCPDGEFDRVFGVWLRKKIPYIRWATDLSRLNYLNSISETSSLCEAMMVLGQGQASRLVVTEPESTTIVGVVSQADVFGFLATQMWRFPKLAKKKVRELQLVGGSKKRRMEWVGWRQMLICAFAIMDSQVVAAVPVLSEDHKLVGMITVSDVQFVFTSGLYSWLRRPCSAFLSAVRAAQAKKTTRLERPHSRCPTTTETVCVLPTDTFGEAVDRLVQTGARQLAVVSADRCLMDLVPLADVLNILTPV